MNLAEAMTAATVTILDAMAETPQIGDGPIPEDYPLVWDINCGMCEDWATEVQEQAWPVLAPQPGEHIYEPDAADRSKWTCIRHQGQPCPPLDTAVLTRATAYPAPPEPETCFCGGKVRYGRCRECGTLYGQREDDQ